jgi:uncharacterized membrane protein
MATRAALYTKRRWIVDAVAGRNSTEELSLGSSQSNEKINVGSAERYACLAGGVALAVAGLKKGGLTGMALGLISGSLLHRGATGHCSVYDMLNVNTAGDEHPGSALDGGKSIKVEKTVTIQRPAEEVFAFWRNFENLPRVMKHLEKVTVSSPTRSHWVAKAPGGTTVEWDAEIINEKPNELIAWKSLEGAEVENAGSVRFESTSRGTVLKVSLMYHPPMGKLGGMVARLFQEEPNQQVQEDLIRLKQLMEAGELSTTKGQSSGRGVDE